MHASVLRMASQALVQLQQSLFAATEDSWRAFTGQPSVVDEAMLARLNNLKADHAALDDDSKACDAHTLECLLIAIGAPVRSSPPGALAALAHPSPRASGQEGVFERFARVPPLPS